MMPPPPPLLGAVFDGDDTLWSTERLYDEARARAREIVEGAGLDGVRWESIERDLDVERVASHAFSPERFPGSCLLAYEAVSQSLGQIPDPAIESAVYKAAASVFEQDPTVVAGARETLSRLRGRGVRLALLTKGDPQVQLRRIRRSRLESCFDLVRIVPEKTPESIRDIVHSLGVNPSEAWMIGNSVRSDILPALSAGIRAIWVNSHVWEYERAAAPPLDPRVVPVDSISEVAPLIAQ